MDMNIIITIIGAIGGAEGLRWIITAWMNRKTNARKEDVAAMDALVNELEMKYKPSTNDFDVKAIMLLQDVLM